jgi:hypothetical protein
LVSVGCDWLPLDIRGTPEGLTKINYTKKAVPVRVGSAPRDLDDYQGVTVNPSSQTTQLSEGQLGRSPHGAITVELVEPEGLPAAIRIGWPLQPTITSPATFDQAVAAAMKVLSNAVVELAAIRVWKRL